MSRVKTIPVPYSTEDEINFITRMKREKLATYYGALQKRTAWGRLNRARILAHCETLLKGA